MFTWKDEGNAAYAAAITAPARTVRGAVTLEDGDGGEPLSILDSGDLQSLTIERGTQSAGRIIGNAYAVKYTVVLLDRDERYKDAAGWLLSCRLWAGLPGQTAPPTEDEAKWIPFPACVVEEVKTDKARRTVTLTAYDALYRASGKIQNLDAFDHAYTVGEYLSALCLKAGIPYDGGDFFASSMDMKAMPNLNGTETYREVIASIAEAALGNAVINREGKLEIRSIIRAAGAQPVLDIPPEQYMDLKLESRFGPVNSLLLPRMPQEDNLPPKIDEASVSANGLCEFLIADNPFIDYFYDPAAPLPPRTDPLAEEGEPAPETGRENRPRYLDPAFEQLNGFTLTPFTLSWRGNPALDCGDWVRITDREGAETVTLYGNDKLIFDGGLRAEAKTYTYDAGESTRKAGVTAYDAYKESHLLVDKVKQEIEGEITRVEETGKETKTELLASLDGLKTTVSQVDDVRTAVSVLEQNLSNLTTTFQTQGGINLLKNSCGRDGLNNWDDGAAGARPYQGNELDGLAVAGSGLELTGGNAGLSQTFATAAGVTYAYFFQYRLEVGQTLEASAVIEDILLSGVAETIGGTHGIPLNNRDGWQRASGRFTAAGGKARIRFASSGQRLLIANLIVAQGEAVSQWSPAYGEILTADMKVNDKGIFLSNGTEYTAQLSNQSTTYMSNGRMVAQFSADGALMGDTVVQDSLTVCLDENASGKLRIIPRSDGAFFVIND